MKFKNLEEFRNYVPNCVICDKEMEFRFKGTNYYYNSPITIKTKYKNNILTNINEDFVIDVNSNKILKTNDEIRDLKFFNIKKKCWTCKFTLNTYQFSKYDIKYNTLPEISLYQEYLNCYLKYHINLDIENPIYARYLDSARIFYNNTFLPFNMYFDFTKYNNLKKIKNVIKMIKTFQ